MHKKEAKNGLVILAVTMDLASQNEKDRAEGVANAQKFLSKLAPPFRTVNLAFDPNKPPPSLNFAGIVPAVFVFNRQNQWVLKLPQVNEKGDVLKEIEEYEPIDRAIAEALKQK